MATFVAEDEESILRQVAAHAHEDHGMTEVPPAVVEQVRLHIVAA